MQVGGDRVAPYIYAADLREEHPLLRRASDLIVKVLAVTSAATSFSVGGYALGATDRRVALRTRATEGQLPGGQYGRITP